MSFSTEFGEISRESFSADVESDRGNDVACRFLRGFQMEVFGIGCPRDSDTTKAGRASASDCNDGVHVLIGLRARRVHTHLTSDPI